MIGKQVANYIFIGMTISAIAPFAISNSAAIAQSVNIIPQQPVEPSLWWKSQRLDEGWVEDITIDSQTKKAMVNINTTRWIASDYLQRFSFLFKLGTEAQKQNFDVMLLNRRDQKLAEYSTHEEKWRIDPTSLGAEPFRIGAPTIFQQ